MLPSLTSEQFPVETRAVGVAFSYSISVTVFGGLAPFFGDSASQLRRPGDYPATRRKRRLTARETLLPPSPVGD